MTDQPETVGASEPPAATPSKEESDKAAQSAPGSLSPTLARIAEDAVQEAKHIWVRFRQMAHIPPGRTVYQGDQVQIPEDHFHPDVHEKIEDPAVTAAQTGLETPTSTSAPEPPLSWLKTHEDRLRRLEDVVFGAAPSAALTTLAAAPPAEKEG